MTWVRQGRADDARALVLARWMNNQWSVGGWGDKPVNVSMQPFVNYNSSEGWYY
jgi:hypothetical protein